jgi:DNA-binding NarL/FixJ family response regulator
VSYEHAGCCHGAGSETRQAAPRESGDACVGKGALIAASRPDLLGRVSPKQREVLELLLDGLTEPQIARRLGRSRHTVHDHTKAIYAALGITRRVQLVLLFSTPPSQPGAGN